MPDSRTWQCGTALAADMEMDAQVLGRQRVRAHLDLDRTFRHPRVHLASPHCRVFPVRLVCFLFSLFPSCSSEARATNRLVLVLFITVVIIEPGGGDGGGVRLIVVQFSAPYLLVQDGKGRGVPSTERATERGP